MARNLILFSLIYRFSVILMEIATLFCEIWQNDSKMNVEMPRATNLILVQNGKKLNQHQKHNR
jgi:hypothetical protein